MHPTAEFDSTIQWIVPVIVAIVFILLCSLMKEPNRKNFMAIIVGGAGAAYLSGGGFGKWELAFCTLMAVCAYNGLRSYRFIGTGWLWHTGWDILHHLYGNPLLPFDATSSLGCAICDPVIAAWCFAGAPSLYEVIRGKGRYVLQIPAAGVQRARHNYRHEREQRPLIDCGGASSWLCYSHDLQERDRVCTIAKGQVD